MLLALFKPYGVLSQFTEEPGSEWKTLAEFKMPKGFYPIGRLDADSEGLLLLSDEKAIVDRLLNPKKAHPREYWAQVEGVPNDESLHMLKRGVKLKDHQCLPCKVTRVQDAAQVPERVPPIRFRKNVADTWLSLELTEGKNRQVRRMTAAVGHPTLRLVRVRMGSLELWRLPLKPGRWMELDAKQRDLVLEA